MAIGASQNLVVNCYSIPWKPGSVALLSTDGLHGVVKGDVLESIIRTGQGKPEIVCRQCIDAARQAGAPDNVTAVILRRVN